MQVAEGLGAAILRGGERGGGASCLHPVPPNPIQVPAEMNLRGYRSQQWRSGGAPGPPKGDF